MSGFASKFSLTFEMFGGGVKQVLLMKWGIEYQDCHLISLFWQFLSIMIPREKKPSKLFLVECLLQVENNSIEPLIQKVRLGVSENYDIGNRDF